MSNIKVTRLFFRITLTFFPLEHHILYISQDSQEGHCPISKISLFYHLFSKTI